MGSQGGRYPEVAVLYCRVSSVEQAREGLSIDAQRARTRQYADRHGWTIAGEFEDVLSGMRDDRRQYCAMLKEVRRLHRSGKAVAVVVQWLDRFGRHMLERTRRTDELRKLGVSLHSVMEGGEVPELVGNMLAAVAQEEVRRMSQRLRELHQYVEDGGWSYGGPPRWGYLRRPATVHERAMGAPKGVVALDQLRADFARDMFRRAAAGEPVAAVARWAQSLSDEVRGGRAMSEQAVRSMLRSPTYIARPTSGQADVLARPTGRWAPLVEDALWVRIQAQLVYTPRGGCQSPYPLKALVRCPTCGARMSAISQYGKRRRYQCNGRALGVHAPRPGCTYSSRMLPVDRAVFDEVTELVRLAASLDCGQLAEVLRHDRGSEATAEERLGAQLDVIEQEMGQLRQRWSDVALHVVDGLIPAEDYARSRDAVSARLDQIQVERRRIRPPGTVTDPAGIEQARERVVGWERGLAGEDPVAMREVLLEFIDHVVPHRVAVAEYRVEIAWTPLARALRASRGGGHPSSMLLGHAAATALPAAAAEEAYSLAAAWLRSIPESAWRTLNRCDRRAIALFFGVDGRAPEPVEGIAASLDMVPAQVADVVHAGLVRLRAVMSSLAQHPLYHRTSVYVEEADAIRRLASRDLDILSDEQRLLFSLYYGLHDGCRYTWADLAARVGLSPRQIRRQLALGLLALFGADAVARRGYIVSACIVCGSSIPLTPGEVAAGRGRVCGRTCSRELARRKLRQPDHRAHAPAARALAAGTRVITDEGRAALSRAARAVGRRRGRSEADLLRTAPPSAFATVSPEDRALIDAFFGFGGREPETIRSLAQQSGQKSSQVYARLRRGIRTVVGSSAPAGRAAHGRPNQKVGRLLAALPASAFDVLEPRAREIVTLRYGLGGGERFPKQELAQRFGLRTYSLQKLLIEATDRLLGRQFRSMAGCVTVSCAVCRVSFAMDPPRARQGKAHVCSAACLSKLRSACAHRQRIPASLS